MESFKTCGAPAIEDSDLETKADAVYSEEDLAKWRERAYVTAHRPWGNLGPFGIRPMVHENKGDAIQGHTHNFDHVTVLLKGSVLLEAQESGIQGEPVGPMIKRAYAAPFFIWIRKNWKHKFTALEDKTESVCMYTHRDFDGGVVQDPNGNDAAYV